MIEWSSFVIVAVVSVISASIVVSVASLGMRLYENALQARAAGESSGNASLAAARVLFGVCGLLVLFGVYLIVPAFH